MNTVRSIFIYGQGEPAPGSIVTTCEVLDPNPIWLWSYTPPAGFPLCNAVILKVWTSNHSILNTWELVRKEDTQATSEQLNNRFWEVCAFSSHPQILVRPEVWCPLHCLTLHCVTLSCG